MELRCITPGKSSSNNEEGGSHYETVIVNYLHAFFMYDSSW